MSILKQSLRTNERFWYLLGLSLCLPMLAVMILHLCGVFITDTIFRIAMSFIIPAVLCFFVMIGIIVAKKIVRDTR
jgi:TctA family transporter